LKKIVIIISISLSIILLWIGYNIISNRCVIIKKNPEQKVILFDFDGTLADSFQLMHKWLLTIADCWGFKKINFETARSMSTKDMLSYVGVKWYQLPYLTYKAKTYMKANLATVLAYPHAKETLYKLKSAGYTLIILSSNSKDNINLFLNRNQINVVDHIVSDSSLFGKDKVVLNFLKN